jgi:hypothetical protein
MKIKLPKEMVKEKPDNRLTSWPFLLKGRSVLISRRNSGD